ncbi:MAG: nitrile hydratase subunit beta [Pseudomonadota bacterium]
MNGPQDLGGRQGFGAVTPEPERPVFHAAWEGRALGLTLCAGALGCWTLDESRQARESLSPAHYLSAPYYEIWIEALETLLKRHGELGEDEIAAQRALRVGVRPDRQLAARDVPTILARGGPVAREPESAPAFQVGDVVRTRAFRTSGHTRLPSYAMGKRGEIVGVRGFHVFPDTNAHGAGEAPCWLYGVAFGGEALWGEGAEPGSEVIIDAFEPYLTRA